MSTNLFELARRVQTNDSVLRCERLDDCVGIGIGIIIGIGLLLRSDASCLLLGQVLPVNKASPHFADVTFRLVGHVHVRRRRGRAAEGTTSRFAEHDFERNVFAQ